MISHRSSTGLLPVPAPRLSLEHAATMGFPLVPLGDGRGMRATTIDRGEGRHVFGPVEWEIVVPTHDRLDGRSPLPSHVILDVWVGLLYQWQLAGAPADGEIRFGRYEFLRLLGWLSGRQGDPLEKPSGRHYRQLTRAMRYLAQTTFVSTAKGVQVGHDGAAFRGVQGFNLIDYWRLADDQGSKAAPSVIRFTTTAQQMLRSGPLTAIDLDLFLALPTGTPRQLLRLITWLRDRGQELVPLSELFARLGSIQRQAVPARARQILTRSHELLQARGILGDEPSYQRLPDGQWGIRYSFAMPLRPHEDLLELLVFGAVLMGVRPAMATHLAGNSSQRLLQVLAAVLQGHLVVQRNLAGLIVKATQSTMPLPDLPNPQWLQSRSAGGRYIQMLARARATSLEMLFARGILPERAMAQFGLPEEGASEWVKHGLWALWALRQLDVPPSESAPAATVPALTAG